MYVILNSSCRLCNWSTRYIFVVSIKANHSKQYAQLHIKKVRLSVHQYLDCILFFISNSMMTSYFFYSYGLNYSSSKSIKIRSFYVQWLLIQLSIFEILPIFIFWQNFSCTLTFPIFFLPLTIWVNYYKTLGFVPF